MIEENINRLRQRIAAAAKKAGRNPEDIVLVAVSKLADISQINEAIKCGLTDFGENRVQDALKKSQVIPKGIKWHMVGHLQTNKAKKALDIFELIHSVDSIHLAETIDAESKRKAKTADVLIQVNTSGEKNKFGFGPDRILENIARIAQFLNIKIKGLMTIAPLADDAEEARQYFRKLFELRKKIISEKIENLDMKYLSMGMTQDFEVAIEEGSNMVRIGTAIFGPNT